MASSTFQDCGKTVLSIQSLKIPTMVIPMASYVVTELLSIIACYQNDQLMDIYTEHTANVILYKSAITIITSYILLLRNVTRYQYIMYLAS